MKRQPEYKKRKIEKNIIKEGELELIIGNKGESSRSEDSPLTLNDYDLILNEEIYKEKA